MSARDLVVAHLFIHRALRRLALSRLRVGKLKSEHPEGTCELCDMCTQDVVVSGLILLRRWS